MIEEASTVAPAERFVSGLTRHGHRPALREGNQTITYDAMTQLVDRAAEQWTAMGPSRRLVHFEPVATIDAVASWLGAARAGHVVALIPPGRGAGFRHRYDPDSIAGRTRSGWQVEHLRRRSRHELHPDLGLLMTTSGSTSSPRLVRLSFDNLMANTEGIVDALGIRAEDVAVTTLPLSYCYGLSVLHTHLAVGASVVLTARSVTDSVLWQQMSRAGVTTLSAVPHTFDLLTAAGRSPGQLLAMRQVTQAGGRLDPAVAREWGNRGHEEGWDLRLMYGQTEATARISVSAPNEAVRHPDRVGRPIAHTQVELRTEGRVALPGEVGEIHVSGRGVMLGHALSKADLALGAAVSDLATGDLARRHPDGTLEILGRGSDFVKIAGLRIDLAWLEGSLARRGVTALVTAGTHDLHALVEDRPTIDVGETRRAIAEVAGLPPHRIRVLVAPALPRTDSGKPDRVTARALFDGSQSPPMHHADAASEGSGRTDRHSPRSRADASASRRLKAVTEIYASCLGVADVRPDASFVALHGDSLSYVEVSVRLEQVLGQVPKDWQRLSVSELASGRRTRRASGRIAQVDTTIVLRAVAIVLIVLEHADVIKILGGAHILLAVAGFNFGRFLAGQPSRRERATAVFHSLARLVIPTVAWVTLATVVMDRYAWPNFVLLNWVFGPDVWGIRSSLWFIEALFWITLAVLGLLSIPAVHRLYTRSPMRISLAVVVVALALRWGPLDLTDPTVHESAPAVLWLFAIGWAAALVRRRWERLLVAGLFLAGMVGYFADRHRELVIIAGVLVLVSLPALALPRRLVAPASALAGASLYIYITHFEVFAFLESSAVTPWSELGESAWGRAAAGLTFGLALWVVRRQITRARIGAVRRHLNGHWPVPSSPSARRAAASLAQMDRDRPDERVRSPR